MNYSQTLDYLYHKLPMFSRMGTAAYKKDLTNIKQLCEALGNPHQKFRSIHVGGTNGKGSVSHMLAAIFQTAGYKTGLHTSPHLYDFRERIRVDGTMVSEEFVVEFVKRIQPLIEKIEPSFFEITVAMAFEAFALQKLDIAIIEVGLGGSLDSTNIIAPEMSIITNIGWDHMNILGNSLEEIAGEKAGIIKEMVPVVIGETLPETAMIFQNKAEALNAPCFFADRMLRHTMNSFQGNHLQVRYENEAGEIVQVATDLQGIYQVSNVRTVLTAMNVLQKAGWQFDNQQINHALLNVKGITGLRGRWDVLRKEPMVVLDVAHNQNGIEKMLEHLRQLRYHQLHIVIGMVKDKEVTDVLRLLPTDAVYYFTQANIPRALEKSLLQQRAQEHGLQGNTLPDVNTALTTALQQAAKDDIIIVCGSIFLVAEVDQALLSGTVAYPTG